MEKLTIFKCTYYILLVTRYKREFFSDDNSKLLVVDGFKSIEEQGLIKNLEVNFGPCYAYVKCDGIPSKSPNQIVTALRRAGYQELLLAIPNLNSLWARPFLLKTIEISQGEIELFLQQIKKRG